MSDIAEQEKPAEAQATPYDMVGGEAGLRRLVSEFYRVMDSDPAMAPLRAMHAADLGPVSEAVFEWLSGWLGGPPLYIQRTGGFCLTGPHRPFPIDQEARDQWMYCMDAALARLDLEPRFREALGQAFGRLASMVRNR